MSSASITKSAIASAMKQLMDKVPFDRITTADIINKCGISRKTFYYHFRDKYDLVNWIFSVEIEDEILKSTTLDNDMERCLRLCQYIRDNKTFYTNAFHASGQNCLIQFLYTFSEKRLNILCKEATNKKILSENDIRFLVDFYYNAFIGVFTTWMKNDMKDSPEIIVTRWIGVVDKSLEHYISTIESMNYALR